MMWHDMDPIQLVQQVPQLFYGYCSQYGHGVGIDMHCGTNPIRVSWHGIRH